MTYVSGSIQNATTPTDELITVLESALAAAGWVYERQIDYDASNRHRMWRCPAALSGEAIDFYLGIRRQSPTSQIGLAIWEELIGDNVRYPAAVGTWTPDASGRNPAAATVPFASSAQHVGLPTNTGGFQYFISATKRRVVMGTKGSGIGEGGVYAGALESLLPTSALDGGVALGTNNGQQYYSSTQGFTREPLAGSYSYAGGMSGFNPFTPTSAADAYRGNRPTASRLLAYGRGDTSARALAHDLLYIQNPTGVTPGMGDTLTFGGKSYARISISGQPHYVDTSL